MTVHMNSTCWILMHSILTFLTSAVLIRCSRDSAMLILKSLVTHVLSNRGKRGKKESLEKKKKVWEHRFPGQGLWGLQAKGKNTVFSQVPCQYGMSYWCTPWKLLHQRFARPHRVVGIAKTGKSVLSNFLFFFQTFFFPAFTSVWQYHIITIDINTCSMRGGVLP